MTTRASGRPLRGGAAVAPPRVARWLAGALIRDASAEFIVGDLDEAYLHERTAARRGTRLRYWRLALASIWARAGSGGSRSSAPNREPGRQPGGTPRRGGSTGFAHDVRFAARMLRKSPVFTVIAVLTLALGIGANTAVFSVLNGVLLRPLPYQDPGRLINVWQVMYEWQDSDVAVFRSLANSFPVSYPAFGAWQERGHMFENLAAYDDFNALVEGPELAEWVPTASTSAALFDVLGVEPLLGRGFTPEEDRIGADRVVVLSHAFWTRHYGADPDVLGEVLNLTGVPHTVIGVMPAGFYFPGRQHHLWTLLRDSARNDRWGNQSMSVIARLRDGVALDDAQREMDAVTVQIVADNPASPDVGIRLVGRVEEIAGKTSSTLLLLMAAVGLVLVVTTTNLAALLLVRATSRRQEIAVRRALGAGRLRLAVQLLIESCLLAGAGGAAALLATTAGMSWIKLLLPDSIPRIDDIAVDGRVLGFTVAISVVIALLFGLASAFHASRHQLIDALRAAGPGAIGGRRRGRSALVVGEITVAVVLMVGATLLLSSYFKLTGEERGFDETNVLTMEISAPREDWGDAQRLRDFFRRTLEGIDALPGVESVAAVESLPFSNGQSSSSFGTVDNSTEESDAWSLENTVSPGYFTTMGVPLLRGRLFDEADTTDSEPVAIVNERLANEYWGGNPIGELLWEDGEPFTIVGVVGDIKHRSLGETVERMRFHVQLQDPELMTAVVVRTRTDPVSLAPAVRAAVGAISPRATVSSVASLASRVADTTALPRFRSLMLSSLAAVAVILAMLGVYGVVTVGVTERQREIGVRMTLGAVHNDILRQVLGGGARLILPGVLLGVAAATFAVRSIESYVYEVPTTDPLTFAGVALAIGAVAVLATWIPARRAARIEPLIVLRGE